MVLAAKFCWWWWADSDPDVDFDEGRSLLSLFLFNLSTLNNININYFLQLLTFCLQTEARLLVNPCLGHDATDSVNIYFGSFLKKLPPYDTDGIRTHDP
jgi:hypothetical protein